MFEQTFKNIDDILHKDAGLWEWVELCGANLLGFVPKESRRSRKNEQPIWAW
jgi:hypothetical protein